VPIRHRAIFEDRRGTEGFCIKFVAPRLGLCNRIVDKPLRMESLSLLLRVRRRYSARTGAEYIARKQRFAILRPPVSAIVFHFTRLISPLRGPLRLGRRSVGFLTYFLRCSRLLPASLNAIATACGCGRPSSLISLRMFELIALRDFPLLS